MEPPTKRPRFGPPPFEDDDDPEADELNSRPEEVNARRDPGLRLERSRAFAAFKFKSALEGIFDKYGKDFTGIGDEIDLRTGEIVVDNGHLQSLKHAQIGGEDGDDDDDDADGGNSDHAAPQAVPLDEEERKLQGKPDNRLRRPGQLALPSIPPQISTPPFFGGGWPGPASMLGAPPGFSTMMYPGPMQFGGFPMQYGAPIPMPTTDPTWSTPELPSSFFGNGPAPGQSVVLVRKKRTQLPFTAAREHDDDDDDDEILRGVSEAGRSEGTSDAVVVRRKLLLSRPSPGKVLGRKTQLAAASPKPGRGINKLGKHQKAGKSPGVDAKTRVEGSKAANETSGGFAGPGTPIPARKESSQDIPESSDVAAVKARQPNQMAPGSKPPLQLGDPDVYLSVCSGNETLTRKPRNQRLRVEIVARKWSDLSLFENITPELSGADSPDPPDSGKDGRPSDKGNSPIERTTAALEPKDPDHHVPDREPTSKSRDGPQKTSTGVFARNIVDPAYAFSDEDEPTLSRKRAPQRKPGKASKGLKPSDTRPETHEVMDDGGMMIHDWEPAPGEALLDADDVVTARAPSPTLSVRLDDIVGCDADGPAEPSAADVEGPRQPNTAAESSGQWGNRKTAGPDETPEWVTRRPKPPTVASQPETGPELTEPPVSNKRRQSLFSKGKQQGTPIRTADSPLQASSSQSPAPRFQDPDPPIPSSEHSQSRRDTIPSPTLTDLASDHHGTTPVKPPPPSTPVKAIPKTKPARSRLPKQPSPPPAIATTAAATPTPATTNPKATTKKRKSLLSLLPHTTTNTTTTTASSSSSEDELSIPTVPTPAAAAPATVSRARLSLRAPGSRSRRHSTTTSTTTTTTNTTTTHKPTSPSNPSTTPQRAVPRPAAGNTAGRRGSSTMASAGGKGFRTPTSARRAGSEMVQTPGGTMRRCGEAGFRCERDFCFVCL
ncbi:hypothetical protein BT67DRAFT_443763 [Trichocladium antarcticum]|uniref:Myb-like DNA-binding domain protein n=1 Tax=Trichocladium antarcticum TaxID=1450529 RepID=A0AAN6ZBV7_9PEZI|nr:hypothetical protein BT67DRAFT_443763 [Trichocladium antarcticum]